MTGIVGIHHICQLDRQQAEAASLMATAREDSFLMLKKWNGSLF